MGELMKFGHKVVVAVDLNETSRERLKALRNLDFLKHAEVHFVYVYQTSYATYGMGEFCEVYPVESDRKTIEQAVLATLVDLGQKVLDPAIKTVHRCLFDENPKEEFCLYAKEVKADTIIVLTHEKHGLFESSFAQYCGRHTPCNLIVLKP